MRDGASGQDDREDRETRRLEAELKQLRMYLEEARDEIAALTIERDAQAALARQRGVGLHLAEAQMFAGTEARSRPRWLAGEGAAGPGDVEAEELRVALEEMQVLAEELEGSNTALRGANEALEARMEPLHAVAMPDGVSKALRAVEERARLILESATGHAIITLDLDGRVTSWNAGAEEMLGWSATEALGTDIARVFTPEDRAVGAPRARMHEAQEHGRTTEERWQMHRDGRRFWAECEMLPLRHAAAPGARREDGRDGEVRGFLKILRDRSERRLMEQTLHAALDERDLLMREVHHRVKNSLQLVQGLLSAQGRAAEPGSAAATQLIESAARVRTIAGMHDRLYQSDPGRLLVELRPYLDGLIEDLRTGMASTLAGRDVRLVLDGEATWPAASVPALGLVATELVTNALKYGAGTVCVRFAPGHGDAPATLVVEDEGGGLPEAFDPRASRGLGMRLVMGLLRGEGAGLSVDRTVGHTRFVVRLPRPGVEEH